MPDDGEAAMNCDFSLPNRAVDRPVRPSEQRRDLVDTEQCICVEREREKHFSCGEVLLVKWRAVGVHQLEVAVTAPDAVEMRPRLNSVVPAAWTGRFLLEFLESPLDACIERLGVDPDDAQLNQLSKHPAERRLSRRQTPRLWLA